MPATGPVMVSVAIFFNNGCGGPPEATRSTTYTMATPAPNGPLEQQCGRHVALVLDESTSIDTIAGGTESVRDAAKAFVNGVADSGVQSGDHRVQQRLAQRGAARLYNLADRAYAAGPFAEYINGNGANSSTRYRPADYRTHRRWRRRTGRPRCFAPAPCRRCRT